MTTSFSPIVFIVDDEEDMRLAMQRILKTVNLRAELFATAQDFLQRNIPDVPSCLVLDVRLPGMGGLEVQQKLIEAGINIPIIFITAHGDIPMTVKAMKSGAFEFLTKPFRHQEFLDAIQQIASALGTSEITAAVHRGRVMHKMQAGSPAELGSMAERLKPSANR
jgi:FixJ family two-component response regulator